MSKLKAVDLASLSRAPVEKVMSRCTYMLRVPIQKWSNKQSHSALISSKTSSSSTNLSRSVVHNSASVGEVEAEDKVGTTTVMVSSDRTAIIRAIMEDMEDNNHQHKGVQ